MILWFVRCLKYSLAKEVFNLVRLKHCAKKAKSYNYFTFRSIQIALPRKTYSGQTNFAVGNGLEFCVWQQYKFLRHLNGERQKCRSILMKIHGFFGRKVGRWNQGHNYYLHLHVIQVRVKPGPFIFADTI